MIGKSVHWWERSATKYDTHYDYNNNYSNTDFGINCFNKIGYGPQAASMCNIASSDHNGSLVVAKNCSIS